MTIKWEIYVANDMKITNDFDPEEDSKPFLTTSHTRCWANRADRDHLYIWATPTAVPGKNVNHLNICPLLHINGKFTIRIYDLEGLLAWLTQLVRQFDSYDALAKFMEESEEWEEVKNGL